MALNRDFLEAEVRQKIIDALKVDLVGPQKENEVLDENPMFEYLTGMLYPKTMSELDALEQEVDMDIEHPDGDSGYTPRPDEDDNEPMTASKFTQQSSIGVSFYLKKTTGAFVVDVAWGDYIHSTEKYVTEKGEEKARNIFTRQPMTSSVMISLAEFSKYNTYSLPEDSNLQLYVVKIQLDNDYQLVTVHLNNKRPKGSSELESVIFQAEISCRDEANGDIFIAENICRDILSEDEFYYEQRPIFGRGRGCAAMWESNNNRTAYRIYSSFIPEYEFPSVEAVVPGFDKYHFFMSFFAKPANKEESLKRLVMLKEAYKNWIDECLVNNPKMRDAAFKAKIGDAVINKCRESLRRISEGIDIVASNEKAFTAFCFMNSVMTLQRSIANYSKKHGKGIECSFGDFVNPKIDENKFCWRPFQIAFILQNLKGIVDVYSPEREIVDLLYFPTGGGKTEAYLGLIAFVIAYRRLNSDVDDGYNRDGGVTAILRYTLRLLTAQQRDRLTKMIIAAEMERQRQFPKFGKEPITIGFWVGGGVTPNQMEDMREDPKDPEKASKNKRLLYKQLLKCPFCGKELLPENYHIDFDTNRVHIYCEDKDCIYYKYGHPERGQNVPLELPVMLVDEEIYSYCPTVILATVDKFAALPWKVRTNSLFGRVAKHCSRDGYVAIGEKEHPIHKSTEKLPKSVLKDVMPFAPPELIVQDELHLITGPLGTIYGAYETIIHELCSYKIGDKTILPKYIVSTATIKNAQEQIRCLYGRQYTSQFPANGFEIGDSFFIKEVPVSKKPFRKYVGISANGQSMKTTVLRVYAVILQTVHELQKDPSYVGYLDPYYTLVGYFNSIRELGGTVRLLQDDIPKRINRLKKKYHYTSERYLNESTKVEITSRIPSTKISERLDQLEMPMGTKGCLDTAIATNMIAVGMDVDRLGLMTVMGQPKQNSEYIQATSRIGRQHPGVVFTIYNPYRPRDLSHYENFVGYHEQLYRYVEGTTATPFAARARDRTLHALVISAIRLLYPEFAENMAANDIADLSKEQETKIIEIIQERLKIVNPQAIEETKAEIEVFIGDWKRSAKQKKTLTYYVGNNLLGKYNRLMNYYSEPCSSAENGTLNSMREVEASAMMYYKVED